MVPEQPRAEAVDGRDPGAVDLARQVVPSELDEPSADPRPELSGGALRVRDDQERVHREPALAHCPDEPFDEDRRLAGARSGRDEDDARLLDRLGLLRVRSLRRRRRHARRTRHIGQRSHHDGHSPRRGSCSTSPSRILATATRARSFAPSTRAQNSSSER